MGSLLSHYRRAIYITPYSYAETSFWSASAMLPFASARILSACALVTSNS